MADPEPIPLRVLINLLKYEFMISDPRFEGVRLCQSTVGDFDVVRRDKTIDIPAKFWDAITKSVKYAPTTISLARSLTDIASRIVNYSRFEKYSESKLTDPPSTTCQIHPLASKTVRALTLAEKELIYQTTRAHDGCYKSGILFEMFFALCLPGQKVSIQIRNEVRVTTFQ